MTSNTTATPQTCMQQILRMSALKGFPDVAQPSGKETMKSTLAAFGGYTLPAVEWIVDQAIERKEFPDADRVRDLSQRFQLMRLKQTRKFPDLATADGRAAFNEALDAVRELTQDDSSLRALMDELVRTCKYFPAVSEIIEAHTSLYHASQPEWRPATDVCAWCGGTGWRRVSDNGCGVSVKCDHRAPDERIDAKQRASGEARA